MLIITLTCDNITCQQISTSFDNLSVTLTFTVQAAHPGAGAPASAREESHLPRQRGGRHGGHPDLHQASAAGIGSAALIICKNVLHTLRHDKFVNSSSSGFVRSSSIEVLSSPSCSLHSIKLCMTIFQFTSLICSM